MIMITLPMILAKLPSSLILPYKEYSIGLRQCTEVTKFTDITLHIGLRLCTEVTKFTDITLHIRGY